MQENQSLVLLPAEKLVLGFLDPKAPVIREEAKKARDELVERAQGLERVAGAASQQIATDLLGEITKVMAGIEEDRKRVKQPFLEFGRKIDGEVANYITTLAAEKSRLKGLLKGFTDEQCRREEAARKKQQEELDRAAAARKEAELAAQLATSQKELAEAQKKIAEADQKAMTAVMAPVPAAPKAEGLRVKQAWKVEVVDSWKMVNTHREFLDPPKVKIRLLVAEIERMAELDPKTPPVIPGCKITWETDVSSR